MTLSELGFHKQAFYGPAVDLALLGTPSMLGYYFGATNGKEEFLAGEKPPRYNVSSAAGTLLLPGAIGYQIGHRRGYDKARSAADRKG